MPVRVANRTSSSSCNESLAIASRSLDKTVLNGCRSRNCGLSFTSVGTRSKQYMTCVYMGCSTHNVPSWSNVAMRASGGTNLGLAVLVVACTKAMIACFAAPSFHDGNRHAHDHNTTTHAPRQWSIRARINRSHRLG